MKTIIIINRGEIKINPKSPFSVPLPGTELSIINLAIELRKKGYFVKYYGNCKSGIYKEVYFYPWKRIFRETKLEMGTIIWVRDYFLKDHIKFFKKLNNILLTSDTISDLESLYGKPVNSFKESLSSYLLNFKSVVFFSESHLRNWMKNIDFPGEINLKPIYPIVSRWQFRKSMPSLDYSCIINTAHPRKSFLNLCKISSALRKISPKYKIHYFGSPKIYHEKDYTLEDGQKFSKLKKDYRNLIIFHDSLGNRDLGREYPCCSIFLHPDVSLESGSLVTIEAIAQGLVPIVSNVGCLPEIVGDGGIVINKNNIIKDSVEAIRKINYKLHKRIFKIQRDMIKKRYHPSLLVSQWETIL